MSKEVNSASGRSLNRSSHVKEALALRLEACAKVNLVDEKRKDVNEGPAWKLISELMDYVNAFNSISEFSTQVWGIPLDKITLINEFVPFLYPLAVRVDVLDRRGRNLLDLDRNSTSEMPGSYNDFMNLQVKFRNYLRKDINADTTSLSTAMRSMNLFDALEKSSCDDRCIPSAQPFYPIPLKPEVASTLFEDDLYFVIEADVVIDELINNWLL